MNAMASNLVEVDPYACEPRPSDPTATILLVDDQPRNLLAMQAILEGLAVNVVTARSGLEALRCLLRQDFAVILLDVQMPGMDGFETARLIRQRKHSAATPIIFLTAFETTDMQMLRGYAVGAVDYLCKPLVPSVLRSKVAVFVEIFQKTEQVKRQAELLRQIELREHQKQLAEARERLEAERLRRQMHLARQIQQHLFLAAPLPVPGFDISGASYPAEATGGDYFDYIPMGAGRLGIAIGDVCGHGFGPALLMAEMRAYLRAFLLTHTDVGEIITLVNRTLAMDVLEGRFATLLLACLDPQTRSFEYVSAGHTTGYLLDQAGEVKTPLQSTGLPLAVLPDSTYVAESAPTLEAGDMIILLTDGIVEAHSADEALFGIERVLTHLQANRSRSAREIVHTLDGAVRDFCGAQAPLDDMTAVVIKVDFTR